MLELISETDRDLMLNEQLIGIIFRHINESGVAASMRNERYCGDVYTRKTFTKDVLSHKSVKNRGERPISTLNC